MSLVSILRMPLMLGRWASRTAVRLSSVASTNSASLALRTQLRCQSDKCQPPKAKCGERFPKPCATKTVKPKRAPPAPEPLPLNERYIKPKKIDLCCKNPCRHAFPRFDALYYRRSDKVKREYQQTWAECPELIIRPQVICCFDKVQFPKMKKRPRQERPQTARKMQCELGPGKCQRIQLAKCRPARIPPSCLSTRMPMDCKKRTAPYPAFSECTFKKSQPCRPVECKCLALPTMCDAWAYHHRQQKIRKVDRL